MTTFMYLVIGPSNEVVRHDTVEAASAPEALSRVEPRLTSDQGAAPVEIWLHGHLELRLAINRAGRDSFAAKSFESE